MKKKSGLIGYDRLERRGEKRIIRQRGGKKMGGSFLKQRR